MLATFTGHVQTKITENPEWRAEVVTKSHSLFSSCYQWMTAKINGFFKDGVSDRSTLIQWKAMYPKVHKENKLDFVSLETED